MTYKIRWNRNLKGDEKQRCLDFARLQHETHLTLGPEDPDMVYWLELQQNKTPTGETPWNILRSWPHIYHISVNQSYKFSGAHARVRIRRANLPLSPLDLGGEPHRVSRSAQVNVCMILILDLVCTAIYASCFLRLLAKGTSKLCEVGQRSSIFLPDALRKYPCGYERIDIDTLHWDPEDASCTAPPKSAADACEDVDGNDVGLRVAVLSRLGSRNLNAPGTSLLSQTLAR